MAQYAQAHHQPWQEQRWVALLLLALLALFITTPLTPQAQGWFVAPILILQLLLTQGSGPVTTLAASGLALALSARYFWWRASTLLAQDNQVVLTVGLMVLLAELLLWLPRVVSVSGRKEMPLGFLRSLALVWLVLTPLLGLVLDISLFPGGMAALLFYGLPHLLSSGLSGMRQAGLAAVRRGRRLATAWGVWQNGGGYAPPLFLVMVNGVALVWGLAHWLLFGSRHELTVFYLFWAAVDAAVLGIAIALADTSAEADAALPPSAAMAAVVTGHRQARRQLARGCCSVVGRLERWTAVLRWWLPRTPVMPVRSVLVVSVLLGVGVSDDSFARPASATKSQSLVRQLSLKELSGFNALKLRTSSGVSDVYFGSRGDELVTKARLHLRYTHSPSLLPKDSHIKVLLNDEVIGVLPVFADSAGKALEKTLEIDPRFFLDLNQLRFQFIGHYSATCEDPLRNNLWADISGSSELELEYQPLALDNDLSALPAPFFDRRDLGTLSLPVLYSAEPALSTVAAAGVVTSWFGEMAGGRGLNFPAHMDAIPPGHGVVIATNADRPAFLMDHPLVDGPTVEIMTNPADGYSKLLLVLGRDGNDIIAAAQSLALGNAAMSGSRMEISSRRDETSRAAYDAPRWVRSDRPTRLGELIDYPQQLQAAGHAPNPLKLDLRIPPDIFGLAGRGIPLDLRFRYSPVSRPGESLLSVHLNKQLLQSFALNDTGGKPLLGLLPAKSGDALTRQEKAVDIPTYRLSGRNRLDFTFSFARYQDGPCPDVPPDETIQALIDPDSTIDLSGFHHFTRMPDLNHFATLGFPFTKYADLSHTVIVMPDHPNKQEIELMMAVLGHLGRATGLPASKVRVVGTGEISLLENADLLVIGSALEQGVLAQWNDYLPASLNSKQRRISQPARLVNFVYEWLGLAAVQDANIISQEKLAGEGPLAMMLGFQSPLSAGYSVVALTASAPEQLRLITSALNDPERASQINGSVSFLHDGGQISSLLVGDTYFVGELPWWVALWFPLSLHPVLLALLTIAATLLLAFVLWRRRLRRSREETP